jgi:D-glycero-alpha-D-manno-heptose-7-phosphate kinase
VIITRSPLRISLGGGGTDLPSYYQEHSGFVMSAAIDKYVYITLHETFAQELIVKYSKMETVKRPDEVKHPIVREALKLVDVGVPYLEIVSMSDIPANTGLGSSGSFTTALLRALHSMKKNIIPRQELAEQAAHIEIDLLGEPVGKQDQYIASFGGLVCFHFHPDHRVDVIPLRLDSETLFNLEDNLLLFFTGFTRAASSILKEQDTRSRQRDPEMIGNLHFIKQLGLDSKAALEAGDLRGFAELMNVHWRHKKRRSQAMSNSQIDAWYELACGNGALGGKLIGAGGGGFLMFYTEDKTRLRHVMRCAGLREVRVRFDREGTTVLQQS